MKIEPIGINFRYYQKAEPSFALQKPVERTSSIEYSLWNTSDVSFGSKRCHYSSVTANKFEKPSKFKIGRLKDLTCPACGQKILTRHEYMNFLTEIRQAPEEDYIDILSNYKKFMCPTELEVFNEIKEQADAIKANGQTPHIAQIVKDLRKIKLPELEKIQLDKIEDMRDAVKPLPKSEQVSLNRQFDTLVNIILNINNKEPFKRKTMIEWLENTKISDEYVKDILLDIAESFPTSSESACAWIVKNSGKDSQGNPRSPLELAEKLVSIASTSTDHLLARNIELNHDDITNYVAMHRGCNSEKTDKSFNEWYFEAPDKREQYIKKYLREVQSSIDNDRIKHPKYKSYVRDCVLNIYKLSNGIVDFREEFCPETITSDSDNVEKTAAN